MKKSKRGIVPRCAVGFVTAKAAVWRHVCAEIGVRFGQIPTNEDLARVLAGILKESAPEGKRHIKAYIVDFYIRHTNRPKLVVVAARPVETAAEPQAVAFVKSDAFYGSREWRQVRYKALLKHGRKCQCCGATPEDGIVLHVDHVKPKHHFPELALDVGNLQVLCADCNMGKGAWDQTDFRMK